MPDIVCYEFFKLRLPRSFQISVVYVLNLAHQSVNVFNKNVISSYQNPFLLLCGSCLRLSTSHLLRNLLLKRTWSSCCIVLVLWGTDIGLFACACWGGCTHIWCVFSSWLTLSGFILLLNNSGIRCCLRLRGSGLRSWLSLLLLLFHCFNLFIFLYCGLFVLLLLILLICRSWLLI